MIDGQTCLLLLLFTSGLRSELRFVGMSKINLGYAFGWVRVKTQDNVRVTSGRG